MKSCSRWPSTSHLTFLIFTDDGGRVSRVPKTTQTRARAARPASLSTLRKETRIARTQRTRSVTRQALLVFITGLQSQSSFECAATVADAVRASPVPSVHFGESATNDPGARLIDWCRPCYSVVAMSPCACAGTLYGPGHALANSGREEACGLPCLNRDAHPLH
ncbi:hypothetical protein CORC01_08252 [Colletotrichum orchidophilum]|uniref:Uncharacterized protein n=1 Tax=Colletotrichum orchidophilum TaxID=1209926 RepID=A0A1G4B4Y2_9PEZI|nr:uncharacterized protein CORC01_08252 [Colletotrichum orchidophilum]OHE96489.1 hypothetical protein CORC01_08252 [Colletotrichum orchidophilum]